MSSTLSVDEPGHPDQRFESSLRERRFKILMVDARTIVACLNWSKEPRVVSLPVGPHFPDDCEIVSISGSWRRGCIEIILCSRHFPKCPLGHEPEVIPSLDTEHKLVKFSVVPEDAQAGGQDGDR